MRCGENKGQLIEIQNHYNDLHPEYEIRITKQSWIQDQVADIFLKVAPIAEGITIPIALAVMLYMVRSWKFCILTILNMLFSYNIAFGLLYYIFIYFDLWFDLSTKQVTG